MKNRILFFAFLILGGCLIAQNKEMVLDLNKYHYVERVDTLWYGSQSVILNIAIVQDEFEKTGVVSFAGEELLPMVFDSITVVQVNDYPGVKMKAFHNGLEYDIGLDIRNGRLLWIHDICIGRYILSHYVSNGDCRRSVLDIPVDWGLWVSVMGGSIPQGCDINTPVTGMSKGSVKKFLKRMQKSNGKLVILDRDECANLQKNSDFLWLATENMPFKVDVHFYIFHCDFYPQVNFRKNVVFDTSMRIFGVSQIRND